MARIKHSSISARKKSRSIVNPRATNEPRKSRYLQEKRNLENIAAHIQRQQQAVTE
jgi:hypothetical protein